MNDYDTSTLGSSTDGSSGLASLAVTALLVIDLWIIFTKAGKPGWGALIPIYNIYVLIKIVGNRGWLILLLLVPLLNIVIWLMLAFDLARVFGRSGLFAFFLLWLLPPIGMSIIAFGESKYRDPEAGPALG